MKTRMGLETLAGAVLVCLGVLTLALIGAGCRGGLLESTSPEGAGLLKGGLTLNTVYNHPHSRAVTNVASVGTNSPMYQAGEGASEDNPGAAVENPKMGAYVTTPTMPATGAGQAATGSGKYVIVVAGDLTRQAEMEISSIASMLAGAKASNLGQGAAPALGPGAAGGAGAGPTGTVAPATIVQPVVPIAAARGATAGAPGAAASAAGAGGTAGPASGGGGGVQGTDGTQEKNYDVVATGASRGADGTTTVTFNGGSVTGAAVGPFVPTDGSAGSVWRITPSQSPFGSGNYSTTTVRALLSPALAAGMKPAEASTTNEQTPADAGSGGPAAGAPTAP